VNHCGLAVLEWPRGFEVHWRRGRAEEWCRDSRKVRWYINFPDICIPDRRHGITEMKWGSTRTLTKLRLESDDSRAPHAVGCDLSSPERSRRRGESARVILAAIRRRDGRTPPDARLPTTHRRAPAVQHWGGVTPTSRIPPVGSREPEPHNSRTSGLCVRFRFHLDAGDRQLRRTPKPFDAVLCFGCVSDSYR